MVRRFRYAETLPKAGELRGRTFTIRVTDEAPKVRRNYVMSQEKLEFAEKQIAAWIKNGTIVPSDSPWSAPLLVAYHPRTGKPRLCVDYRMLNQVTVGDAYLMPDIKDITHAMKGAKVMSHLDLVQGFGQHEVEEASQKYTAFRGTKGGLWQFRGAPFGLKNVPAAFQRFMDNILGTLNWKCASIYIDDCIVFSRTVEDHIRDLNALADRFAEYGVYVKPSKCDFFVTEVEHLGYIFNGDSIRVLPSRVQAIVDVAIPKDAAELRKFLGLTGQFRHLIQQYADIASPLEKMKHPASKQPFTMSPGSAGWAAFFKLKVALLRMPVLYIPDMNKPFRGYADASEVAISFILCQVDDQGQEQVVAFYSKALSSGQLSWSIPVKECHAVRYFLLNQVYPFIASGGPHEIFVDSTASLALQQSILADKRLQAIAQDICGLPLEFRHVRGPKNPSDPLTRPPFADIDPNLAEIKMFNPLLTDPAWAHIRKELHLDQDSVLARVAMITRAKAAATHKEVAKLPDVEVHIESFVSSSDDADSPTLVLSLIHI